MNGDRERELPHILIPSSSPLYSFQTASCDLEAAKLCFGLTCSWPEQQHQEQQQQQINYVLSVDGFRALISARADFDRLSTSVQCLNCPEKSFSIHQTSDDGDGITAASFTDLVREVAIEAIRCTDVEVSPQADLRVQNFEAGDGYEDEGGQRQEVNSQKLRKQEALQTSFLFLSLSLKRERGRERADACRACKQVC